MFFRRIIIPAYQKVVYRGIYINGKWFTNVVTPVGTEAHGIADIEQIGDKFSITFTFSLKRKDKSEIEQRIFKGHGTLYNHLVIFTAKNINKAQIGYRTYLLEVNKGGEMLTGNETWFSFTESKVRSQESKWYRNT